MDNLHYRLIFDLVKKPEILVKNFPKVAKFQNLVENDVLHVLENIVLQSLQIFYIIVLLYVGNCCHFRLKNCSNFQT